MTTLICHIHKAKRVDPCLPKAGLVQEETAKGYKLSFKSNGNVLALMVMMDAKFFFYLNYLIIHFKWVNCRLCNYLNKALRWLARLA